jgi:pyrroline-5-carboxylate reductase
MLPINVDPNVTPSSPRDEQPTIGLIGMGAMGKMYANCLAEAGWQKYTIGLPNCMHPNLLLAEYTSVIFLNGLKA